MSLDAIRWASALATPTRFARQKSEDIIFAGRDKNRNCQVAEVALDV